MKKKILYVISCLLIVVSLITVTGCGKKKENNENNNNNNTTVETGLMSVALKNNKEVVTFTKDGIEKTIYDMSDSYDDVVYTVYNNKLYLYLFKFGNKGAQTLAYIDLSDETNKLNILQEKAEGVGYPVSIAGAGNALYYTTISGSYIYKYDLTTNKTTKASDLKLDNKSSSTHLHTINGEILAYNVYGSVNSVATAGLIDVKTGTKTEIAKDCSIEAVYGDKILYLVYDNGSNEFWTYYEYDIKTNTSKAISDKAEGGLSLYDSLIVPVDDYYVYVSKDTLYKYADKSEELYKLNDYINQTVLISKDKITVEYAMSMDDEAKHGVLDVANKEFKEIDKTDTYTRVVYIK